MENESFCVAGILTITNLKGRVSRNVSSKCIRDISDILQKLLRYFNGTSVMTCFILLAGGLIPLIPFLNGNDVEFAKLAFLHVDINFQLSFNIYHYTVINHA